MAHNPVAIHGRSVALIRFIGDSDHESAAIALAAVTARGPTEAVAQMTSLAMFSGLLLAQIPPVDRDAVLDELADALAIADWQPDVTEAG